MHQIKFTLAKRMNPESIWTSVLSFLPFPELKKQSISTLEREWDTQSTELGTSPSCGGLRSVVRTRHQPGRSLGRSNSSTVWPVGESGVGFRHQFALITSSLKRILLPLPVQTDSSVLHPAEKSWRTTVSSHPPESCKDTETSCESSINKLMRASSGVLQPFKAKTHTLNLIMLLFNQLQDDALSIITTVLIFSQHPPLKTFFIFISLLFDLKKRDLTIHLSYRLHRQQTQRPFITE